MGLPEFSVKICGKWFQFGEEQWRSLAASTAIVGVSSACVGVVAGMFLGRTFTVLSQAAFMHASCAAVAGIPAVFVAFAYLNDYPKTSILVGALAFTAVQMTSLAMPWIPAVSVLASALFVTASQFALMLTLS